MKHVQLLGYKVGASAAQGEEGPGVVLALAAKDDSETFAIGLPATDARQLADQLKRAALEVEGFTFPAGNGRST